VTQDVEPLLGTGRVTVSGEDWAARSTEPIPAGATVKVVGADGIVLEVTRA
jgi:membrane protein implicated in regulation of membrane protease activity